MSFTLLDLGSENFEFRANIWNWKPTLEIIKSFDIVDEGKLRQMSYNATGAQFSDEEARTAQEWKNYSASYDWLKDFSEFCLKSEGFQVF